MPTTTQAHPERSFVELPLFDLATVTGGCGGKKQQCCPCPPPQQAAQPAQLPAAAAPSDPVVSTNVSVSGYGG